MNKRVTELEGTVNAGMKETLQAVNSNQTQTRIELDQLKDDIKEISGRVEDNEHLLRRTVEKDLGAQDASKADLRNLAPRLQELERAVNRHSEYLHLEPLKKLDYEADEGQPVIGKATEEPKTSEIERYDFALALYKDEKFESAIDGFKRFVDEFPKSDLADNAQFWIGECFMALKQYEQAILAYQEVIKKYPKENKVPNAMLRQAIAFLEIKDETSSKLLLKKLIKEHPKSSEAEIAKTKLKQLE
ncbi:MAG: tol-pal system protein YbgF [Deltaproteobacteria bacterium]|nr:tol-pal system protein YbgF [Deltaproteobacteria bacterium]